MKEKSTKERSGKGGSTKGRPVRERELRERLTKERAEQNSPEEITAARDKMQSVLEQMRQKGVKLFVDGEAALPGEIASKAVCEGSTYMADYVLGESGAIEQVRFDKVTGK